MAKRIIFALCACLAIATAKSVEPTINDADGSVAIPDAVPDAPESSVNNSTDVSSHSKASSEKSETSASKETTEDASLPVIPPQMPDDGEKQLPDDVQVRQNFITFNGAKYFFSQPGGYESKYQI